MQVHVRLVEWAEGRIEDPPDPDTDECHLDLVYQTQCDDESIASVAKKLGLEERFLLRLNKGLNKNLTIKSKLRKGHYLLVEDEVPEDMIDEVNHVLDNEDDDPTTPTEARDDDEKSDDEPELPRRSPRKPGRKPSQLQPSAQKKKVSRQLPMSDATEMDADGWAARAAKKAKRPQSKAPAHASLEAQNEALKEHLREAYKGAAPPPGLMKKLGVSAVVPEPRRMPAPTTAQGLLLRNAVLDTQGRIDSAQEGSVA